MILGIHSINIEDFINLVFEIVPIDKFIIKYSKINEDIKRENQLKGSERGKKLEQELILQEKSQGNLEGKESLNKDSLIKDREEKENQQAESVKKSEISENEREIEKTLKTELKIADVTLTDNELKKLEQELILKARLQNQKLMREIEEKTLKMELKRAGVTLTDIETLEELRELKQIKDLQKELQKMGVRLIGTKTLDELKELKELRLLQKDILSELKNFALTYDEKRIIKLEELKDKINYIGAETEDDKIIEKKVSGLLQKEPYKFHSIENRKKIENQQLKSVQKSEISEN